jgi:hypothetical protein
LRLARGLGTFRLFDERGRGRFRVSSKESGEKQNPEDQHQQTAADVKRLKPRALGPLGLFVLEPCGDGLLAGINRRNPIRRLAGAGVAPRSDIFSQSPLYFQTLFLHSAINGSTPYFSI